MARGESLLRHWNLLRVLRQRAKSARHGRECPQIATTFVDSEVTANYAT